MSGDRLNQSVSTRLNDRLVGYMIQIQMQMIATRSANKLTSDDFNYFRSSFKLVISAVNSCLKKPENFKIVL